MTRCCSSHPLAAQGPRVWCVLSVGHGPDRWHEGTGPDGTRWAWWGTGCPLERPLERRWLWVAA